MPEDEPPPQHEDERECSLCGALTKLVRRVPKVGGLPELLTFECGACGDVVTVEESER